MNKNDTLQRFLFENTSIRGEVVHLSESFSSIINQYPYPAFIKQLLGEALVSISLLAAIFKVKGRLTLQFQSKGALKLLLVQCNDQFHLRGLVDMRENITLEEMQASFQQGTLMVTMDLDIAKGKRYQGIVEWIGESLSASLENYFKLSEQLPTKIWIAVEDNQAAGLLLQVMPKEKPEYIQDDWERLVYLTQTVTDHELLTLETKDLLHRLYFEEDVRLFPPESLQFKCECSLARSQNAILLLGRKEAEEELRNKKNIVVTCEFCNHDYVFDAVDVALIFKRPDAPLH